MDKLTRNKGFSIIEILIAMAIGLIVISGVVAGSGGFSLALRGYQSTIMNGETNASAIGKAQQALEQSQALGRQDFNLVNPVATTSTDGFYYTSVDVTTQPDFLTKLVTATVSWWSDHNATSTVRLSTLVTDLENVNSPNTCNSVLSGDWNNAQMSLPVDVDNSSNNASGNPVTDIKAFDKKLYIVTDNLHGHNEDFYIYDISADPQNPTFVGAIEVNGVTPGFNAVAISSTTAGRYAYLGNAHDPNFKTCVQSASCSQVEVIDINTPSSPILKFSFKLSTTSIPYVWGNGGSGQATGKSLFYKDGYLYLGLSTTANGPGFHIIDVHNPLAPSWVSSWPMGTPGFGSSGAPINAIYVKGSYAYLAHPSGLTGAPTEQMTVLNVSNPATPSRVSGFFYNGGIGGNGKSLSVVGSTLYLGRTASNISGVPDKIPEFFILNNLNPESIPSTAIGSTTLPTAEGIVGLTIREYLAFFTTNYFFRIWNIADPTVPVLVKSFDFESIVGSGSTGNATDCEGNNIYIGSYRSNNDKGVILVAYPGTLFDYTLSNSGMPPVAKGDSGSTVIARTFVSGATTPIALNVSGLPAHTSVQSITPNSCSPTCTSTLTIKTLNSATPGDYTITVSGSPDGAGPRSTTFTLTITP